MSPAFIHSLKILAFSIFQFSHSRLLWNCPFIFIKSWRNNFLTRYISLSWNFNFWLWVDQFTFLKRVCRKSFFILAHHRYAWLRWKVRRPQNPTRQYQDYCSLQALCHSSNVTDALWWGGRRQTGSLGIWGF